MKLRILIADDHQLVLEGLKRIIEPFCDIVGTATNGRDLLDLAATLKPDMILADVAMPLLNGIEVVRRLKRENSSAKFLVVTMQLSREYIREAFEAGASAYVVKHAAASDLVAAIRDVQAGHFFLSPMISDRFLPGPFSPGQNPSKLFTALTPRQREVLQLVAEGKSAKEIATLLNISTKTVEFHKKHLMEQLNMHSSVELVRYAVEQGWVAQ